MQSLDHGDTRMLIETCKFYGLLRNQAAYVLGTIYHETAGTMTPVREAFWLSEAWRKRNLRYYPWYGRGHIQLTWEANYERAEREIGVEFTANPDLVMESEHSVEIAVRGCRDGWFTGKRLADYITLQESDFVEARRVVNGTDKADLIAGYARYYDDALLKLDRYGVEGEDGEGPREIIARMGADLKRLEQMLDG